MASVGILFLLLGCTPAPAPGSPPTESTETEAPDSAPSFTVAVDDQTYTVGDTVTVVLPLATGGNGTLSYSLEPPVPGLLFDPDTRTLSGVPTIADTYHMTYQVVDADANTDASDAATHTFIVTILAVNTPDTAPRFSGAVDDQTYTVGDTVTVVLPLATGGNGTLSYSLEPPVPGLLFDSDTRTLSGVPTIADTYHMTYQVVDADANTDASDAATHEVVPKSRAG